MTIVWTEIAERDLYQAVQFIARDNMDAAMAVADRIGEAVERLAEFPKMGRKGRWPESRELVVAGLPFVVPYRVQGRDIVILGIMHTSRSWPDDAR